MACSSRFRVFYLDIFLPVSGPGVAASAPAAVAQRPAAARRLAHTEPHRWESTAGGRGGGKDGRESIATMGATAFFSLLQPSGGVSEGVPMLCARDVW